MLFLYLSVIFIFITPTASALQPIRHLHIDVLTQHTYLVSHVTHKIGLGVSSPDLRSCIDICFNHDFCRTAVYDLQLFVCYLFEECSTQGQIVPNAQTTLISFLACVGEPTNMAFVQSLTTPIPVATAIANLRWITDLPLSPSRQPFFVNEHIYVPVSNGINVYETDAYTLIRTIQLPAPSGIYFVRGDSQGTFIYYQNGDSNLYIYSSLTNIVTPVSSSFVNSVFCYSASFIVISSWISSTADVYLRSTMNNSATFIYRINNWNQLNHCVIINDQELIVATVFGSLQTTILSKTSYNSTINVIPFTATWLINGATVSTDAAGRIYAGLAGSTNVSTVYLPDVQLVVVRGGTLSCAGKTNKYKFIFMLADGSKVSVFEYAP